MVMTSTILLQQFLRQDMKDEAKELLSDMFITVIAVIVLVNFSYLVLTLYEQWQESKKEKIRKKLV